MFLATRPVDPASLQAPQRLPASSSDDSTTFLAPLPLTSSSSPSSDGFLLSSGHLDSPTDSRPWISNLLYLHNNRLSVVQQGSLDLLPGLEVLNLSNNISWIDGEALAPLYSLAILALEGTTCIISTNPWNCDCELHRVFSKILYVRHLHVDDYRNVTCRDPPQLAGSSLSWVDSQLCLAETVTVLVITVTVMVTVVAAVVMAERNRKRNSGKKWDAESQTQT
ncbi:hypothetical protein D4764_0170310 [Takifugu flavidus]|uniref:LRRCT domain-containing protein n=1 Tax=Takifugu flavidus TaxID=433684 RepID=A0A5C6MFU3_9TELE|nr:hypothetical protein D4764_0170310 [Takifugu flavidus]